jgi:PTH1 family peptidyl-tRNA hydrolase
LADPWLVAGLGNPGEKYAGTRHNAGAMVVETLADRLGTRLRKVRLLAVRAGEGRHEGIPLLLATPLTFMNSSGPPIASFARKRQVPVGRVIACHDEIDLAFGALRVKLGGSTAGHHGLDSMVQAFRSADFYRVRLGVGKPSRRPRHVGFLLGDFGKKEREEFAVLIEDAADAVLSLVTDGLSVTQGRYNRSGVREN